METMSDQDKPPTLTKRTIRKEARDKTARRMSERKRMEADEVARMEV